MTEPLNTKQSRLVDHMGHLHADAFTDFMTPLLVGEVESAIWQEHRRGRFVDVSLGIDCTVCVVCHYVLDSPDDWDDDVNGDWSYPFVQAPWPCKTLRFLAVRHADRPGYRSEWAP